MPKRLADVEAQLAAEQREARRWADTHDVGDVAGENDGQSVRDRTEGGAFIGGRQRDGMRRLHREPSSYSQFPSLDDWEQWMLSDESSAGYRPLVGHGPLTVAELEKRVRTDHVLSFLTEGQRELLQEVLMQNRTQVELADEQSVTRQAVNQRLQTAMRAFREQYELHWNDEVELDQEDLDEAIEERDALPGQELRF